MNIDGIEKLLKEGKVEEALKIVEKEGKGREEEYAKMFLDLGVTEGKLADKDEEGHKLALNYFKLAEKLAEDKELIKKARFLSQQARDNAPHYEHSQIGYNYRMSNILAAIGLGQLRVLDERIEQKRQIFNKYKKAFEDINGIDLMPEAPYGKGNLWLTCMTIDSEKFGTDRETLRESLEAENIEARPLWKPMHLQPLFADCQRWGGQVAEYLFDRGLCMPSGTAMTEADLHRVIAVFTMQKMTG